MENRSDGCSWLPPARGFAAHAAGMKSCLFRAVAMWGALIPLGSTWMGAWLPLHRDEGCSWGRQWLIPSLRCFYLKHPLSEGEKNGRRINARNKKSSG